MAFKTFTGTPEKGGHAESQWKPTAHILFALSGITQNYALGSREEPWVLRKDQGSELERF